MKRLGAVSAAMLDHMERHAELRCTHPHKKPCGYCHERFCPNDGCDPNHVEMCREAMRP